MARSPHNREKVEIAKRQYAAERRARRMEAILRERAAVAGDSLSTNRSLAVVAMAGASTSSFQKGLDSYLGAGRVLWLPADRTIQGFDAGEGYGRLIFDQITKHRRTFKGLGVIAFTDYRFKERKTRKDGTEIVPGTPSVRGKVEKIMTPPEEVTTGQTPLKRLSAKARWMKNEPSVLFIGEGEQNDLPMSPNHDPTTNHAFGARDLAYLVLNTDGELRSIVEELGVSERPDPRVSPGGVQLPYSYGA